ncbi:uncharacterized protein LOC129594616 [Paramacrobiotus metropolitanus]|uniref:uncharacterized protein LOC129594616 n=1 Tax=Paramacrobiotus metropolitanus TaxID=2943436 RepID=UPI0024456DAE|nr:uncharacterized protein LOC129594616 [Paramacrobiotus metropolitanus]
MMKFAAGFFVVSLVHFVYVATESAEECAAIRQRCYATMAQFPNISLAWPPPGGGTSSSMLQATPDGDRFCSYSNATGSCLRELRTRCPASNLTQHEAIHEGWYTVVVNELMGKICNRFNPIRFLAAKMHCDRQTNTRDFTVEVVLGENITEFVVNANTEEKAQAALCRKAREFLRIGDPKSKTANPKYTDLVAKCGQDAIGTLEDGMEWTLIGRLVHCQEGH